MKLYCFVFCLFGIVLPQLAVSQSMLTTIDLGDVGYGNREFAGFEAFSPILADKEVVMLGEQ